MKTFIMMTKITPKDADIIEVSHKMQEHSRNSSDWLSDIKAQCPEVKILAQYSLLGPYDFMCIYEAPDEKTAAKVSMLSRAKGTYQIESWNAMPTREISDIIEGIHPGTSRTKEY